MKRVLLLVVALAFGCGAPDGPPRPQALVFIDTDLPSPLLADRVRIDVLRFVDGAWETACDGCSREVAIRAESDWPLSFGVEAPDDGSELFVRATLFPVGRIAAGRPLPETAIERIVELSFDSGVLPQELFLDGRCVGIAPDPASASSCVEGRLAPVRLAPVRDPDAPSRVGSFREEVDRECSGEPKADTGFFDEETCIPGGSYWMGDVRRQGFGGHVDAVPEHLVTVSPFYMDRHEYTVGRYRDALARGFVVLGSPPGTDLNPLCTLPDDGGDASNDDLPLNCVRPLLAEELCAFDGGRLPTEAEWEWAAGNLEEESLFPWGDLRTAETTVRDGVAPVGSRDFDVTNTGARDMSWNLIEWVADDFQTYIERCWRPGNYDDDPLCRIDEEDIARGRSARGGYWMGDGDRIASHRAMIPTRQAYPANPRAIIGFRCARDD